MYTIFFFFKFPVPKNVCFKRVRNRTFSLNNAAYAQPTDRSRQGYINTRGRIEVSVDRVPMDPAFRHIRSTRRELDVYEFVPSSGFLFEIDRRTTAVSFRYRGNNICSYLNQAVGPVACDVTRPGIQTKMWVTVQP